MAICLPVGKEKPASPPSLGPATDWLRQLSRVSDDAWLGGVCGGLGRHTPIPSWCWRAFFLLMMFAYGVGFVPYILLWIFLPAPRHPSAEPAADGTAAEAPPADGRPSWHPPAPAAKNRVPNLPASSQAAFYAAVVLLLGLLFAIGLLIFFVRQANQQSVAALRPAEIDPPAQSTPASTAELEAPSPTPAALAPISSQEFGRLVKSLRASSFDEGKLAFIKTVSHSNAFTTDQARQLLGQFTYDDDRVAAAVVLYPRLTDPQNFYRVLEAFTYDSGREETRKRLKLE